jgi:hypothetical protein
MSRIIALIALLIGLGTGPARAQTFGPPVPTERLLVLLDREGNVRFTLASYYAQWENPFQWTVTSFSNTLQSTVSKTIHVIADTPPSPLVEGLYVLGRRWSVGFWVNPIRGERLRQQVSLVGLSGPLDVDVERDANLADLHVIYYAPRGLSAQVGYYREHGTYRDRGPDPDPPFDYTLVSWNFWLTQRLDVFWRDRLTIARLQARVIPFLSVGYHPSAALNHAVSLQAGVAINFRERLSLSGSVWFFELGTPTASTRLTGGLVLQF